MFQHGVALPETQITSSATREELLSGETALSPAAQQRVEVGYRLLDAADLEARALRDQISGFGRHQPACRALTDAHFGIGPLIAVVIWSELGDCRRFCRSAQVVRLSGLDPTVHSSDRRRSGGHLSRQGPGTLRWALFEAGMCASRATSPDRDYYQKVKATHDGKLAAISVARKLARRCYHTLRALDPDEVYAIPAGF